MHAGDNFKSMIQMDTVENAVHSAFALSGQLAHNHEGDTASILLDFLLTVKRIAGNFVDIANAL
eukprot:m.945673 g.945673  ORF g.945673 m.945673 type:complete len:64 (-) comp289432_c0_seq1:255-446(-)